MTKRTQHEISFEFPYTVNGGDAAYFDCKALFLVDWGQKAIHYPPPGDPGYGPEVEEITNLQIDAGSAGWCTPDPALAKKIYDYLSTPNMESWLIDKAGADK